MSKSEEKRYTHPSYGVISIDRVCGTEATALFGSSIKSKNAIQLKIQEAELCRMLNQDYIHTTKNIIEVEMSESQFAQMITSLNYGEGTPCTISYRVDKGGIIEECPFVDKRQEFEQEFRDLQEKEKTAYEEFEKMVQSVMEKKNVTKTDRAEILKQISLLKNTLFRTPDYTYRKFNEQMDKSVREAKGEIESFMQTRLRLAADMKDRQEIPENLDHMIDF